MAPRVVSHEPRDLFPRADLRPGDELRLDGTVVRTDLPDEFDTVDDGLQIGPGAVGALVEIFEVDLGGVPRVGCP